MSHSKRNTSLAFFTSYERDQLRSTWGSQTARLNRDSFLPFGSCSLCLQPSRDPVACTGGPGDTQNVAAQADPSSQSNPRKRKLDEFTSDQGQGKKQCHIFCRECAISSLLSQKKELKRLEREREKALLETAERDALDDEAAQIRAVEDFERVQMGLEAKVKAFGTSSKISSKTTTRSDVEAEKIPIQRQIAATATASATETTKSEDGKIESADGRGKRDFTLDENELVRIAQEERSKARKALDDEASAAAKAQELPSFWVPALTPSSKPDLNTGADATAEKKLQSLCPASSEDTAHALSLKTLVSVHFHEEMARDGNGKIWSCPACNKPLTNTSRGVLAKPCGHVLCAACVEKFVLGEEADELGRIADVQCFVCGETLTERRRKKEKEGEKFKDKDKMVRGLVEICSEGTGFASGGKNVVKKAGTVFQC